MRQKGRSVARCAANRAQSTTHAWTSWILICIHRNLKARVQHFDCLSRMNHYSFICVCLSISADGCACMYGWYCIQVAQRVDTGNSLTIPRFLIEDTSLVVVRQAQRLRAGDKYRPTEKIRAGDKYRQIENSDLPNFSSQCRCSEWPTFEIRLRIGQTLGITPFRTICLDFNPTQGCGSAVMRTLASIRDRRVGWRQSMTASRGFVAKKAATASLRSRCECVVQS